MPQIFGSAVKDVSHKLDTNLKPNKNPHQLTHLRTPSVALTFCWIESYIVTRGFFSSPSTWPVWPKFTDSLLNSSLFKTVTKAIKDLHSFGTQNHWGRERILDHVRSSNASGGECWHRVQGQTFAGCLFWEDGGDWSSWMEPFFFLISTSLKWMKKKNCIPKIWYCANSPAGKKQDAVDNGIDLSSNAFMLIHGWTVPWLGSSVENCSTRWTGRGCGVSWSFSDDNESINELNL